MNPQTSDQDDHYPKIYAHFGDPLYAELRREAFGEDIGQTNWSTAEEHRRFLSWLELSSSDRMLDVGCGSGGPTIYLARESGCRASGIDNNPQAVAYAAQLARCPQLNGLVTFAQANADQRLPFPDASFDAVICLEAIAHLADRQHALRDWARLLKPGGRLLFTNPVTVTGLISDTEVAARSRIGRYLFTPLGEDARLIGEAGLELRIEEDVTQNMAIMSGRRWRARAAHAELLREAEGDATYEAHQEAIRIAERLALEGRLSRFVYVAVKPG